MDSENNKIKKKIKIKAETSPKKLILKKAFLIKKNLETLVLNEEVKIKKQQNQKKEKFNQRIS